MDAPEVHGPPFARPHGKSPRGKKWNAQTGAWVKQKKQKKTPPASSDEVLQTNETPTVEIAAETSTAMVVHPDVAEGEGDAEGLGTDSSEEAGGNTHLGVDASHPLGSLDDPIADGRCTAIALAKLKVFPSVAAAVEALDQQRDGWTRIREDHSTDAFLGTRGLSWHRQLVQRAVLAAGYDFRLTPVLEMTSTGSYLVDGLANDRYQVGDKWVEPYELNSPDDNPRDNPRDWQHVVAIKNGKIMRTYNSIKMKWLHLDSDGQPDLNKGFFRRIDRVYRVSKPEVEATEVEPQNELHGTAEVGMPISLSKPKRATS